MIYYSKIIKKTKQNKSSFPPFIFIHSAEVEVDAVPRIHNEIYFFLSFVVLLLKLNNWKGKKRETLLLFLKVLTLVYERERWNRRPSHSKSSDRSLSLHDPILIYLSWAKCPPKTIGSWNPPPPRNSFLSLNYYITSLSLMKFNQTRF